MHEARFGRYVQDHGRSSFREERTRWKNSDNHRKITKKRDVFEGAMPGNQGQMRFWRDSQADDGSGGNRDTGR